MLYWNNQNAYYFQPDTARTSTCLIGTAGNFIGLEQLKTTLSVVSTTALSISGGTPPFSVNWYGKDTNALGGVS